MNQRCRLQRLTRLLLSQLPQLVINERKELLGGSRIAQFNLRQDTGDVGHRGEPEKELDEKPSLRYPAQRQMSSFEG